MINYFTILLVVCFASIQVKADSISFLGSTGGKIRDIAVYDDVDAQKTYLYVAQGAAIIIYDVTDYQNPVEVNRFFTSPDRIYNMSISDGILAVSCKIYGSRIYSLSNPVTPQYLFSIGGNTYENFISGNLLYYRDQAFGPQTGSFRCTKGEKVYNIEDSFKLILLEEYETCANNSSPSYFITPANTKVSNQNLFWTYNRGPYSVIWNSPNGLGLPPPDSVNRNIFPPTMILAGKFNIYDLPNLIPYEDKVIITTNEKVYAYNPLIIDTTPEIIEILNEEINGSSILDSNKLYVSINSNYQIIDLSDLNHPIKTYKISKPSFEPRFIQDGVAFGLKSEKITLKNLLLNTNKEEDITISKFSINDFNSGHVELKRFPIDIVINNSHYKDYNKLIEIGSYSIYISDNFERDFGEVARFIFLNDESDPENPTTIESYFVGFEIIPSPELNGNILSMPAGDSGTFHFLLDDQLFGTPVYGWERY